MNTLLENINRSKGNIPKIFLEWSIFDNLTSNILSQIESALIDSWKHWVLINSPVNEFSTFKKVASHNFTKWTRDKNLWWHIDSLDRDPDKQLRMTGLYSPVWSYSHSKTLTWNTDSLDKLAYDFIQANTTLIDSYPEAFNNAQKKANQIVWELSKGYYINLLNCFLADRNANKVSWNTLLWLRDTFTKSTLTTLGWDIWYAWTNHNTSSLFLFKNWLWWDRSLSHTRFNLANSVKWSIWNVLNLSINEKWSYVSWYWVVQ